MYLEFFIVISMTVLLGFGYIKLAGWIKVKNRAERAPAEIVAAAIELVEARKVDIESVTKHRHVNQKFDELQALVECYIEGMEVESVKHLARDVIQLNAYMNKKKAKA